VTESIAGSPSMILYRFMHLKMFVEQEAQDFVRLKTLWFWQEQFLQLRTCLGNQQEPIGTRIQRTAGALLAIVSSILTAFEVSRSGISDFCL
jgi:hypothetical protein